MPNQRIKIGLSASLGIDGRASERLCHGLNAGRHVDEERQYHAEARPQAEPDGGSTGRGADHREDLAA